MPRLLVQDRTASLEFRANDSRATATMDFVSTAGQPFAAGIWVLPALQTAAGGGTIMGVRSGSGSGDLWKISNSTAGILSLEYDTTGAGASTPTTIRIVGSWHHVALVYDGSNIIGYLDGAEVIRSATLTTASIDQTNFAIGLRADTLAEDYKGYARDAFVSNTSLTPAEVAQIYTTGIYPSHIKHIWYMNEGSGSTLSDARGGLNLNITGATWSTNVPTCLRTHSSSRSALSQPRSKITAARTTA